MPVPHSSRVLRGVGLAAAAVGLGLGCGSPAAVGAPERSPKVSVALAQEFEMRPGETAEVRGTNLRLTFVAVLADSRCPIDAVCVRAGDATIRLRARGAGEADVELGTGADAPAQSRSATFEGYRVDLLSLTNPNRASATRPPEPRDYVGTFRVAREGA